MFSFYSNVCNFGYFPLCLGGGTVILIEAVPGLCLPVTICPQLYSEIGCESYCPRKLKDTNTKPILEETVYCHQTAQ